MFGTITNGNGSKIGSRINDAYIRNLLPRLAKKAGIEKRVHAHGLRHSHAFELANEGVPIHIIQKQLGHSNLSVTNRYIDHLNPTEVADAMRCASESGIFRHERVSPSTALSSRLTSRSGYSFTS